MNINVETKEHILSWIRTLQQEISSIDFTKEDYSYDQVKEILFKLNRYVDKLERGDYND